MRCTPTSWSLKRSKVSSFTGVGIRPPPPLFARLAIPSARFTRRYTAQRIYLAHSLTLSFEPDNTGRPAMNLAALTMTPRSLSIEDPTGFCSSLGISMPLIGIPFSIPGITGSPVDMRLNLGDRPEQPVEVIALLFPEAPRLGKWVRQKELAEFKAEAEGAEEVLADSQRQALAVYRVLHPHDLNSESPTPAGWIVRRLQHPGGHPDNFMLSPFLHSYTSTGDIASIKLVEMVAEAMACWDREYRNLYCWVAPTRPPALDYRP